GGLGGELAATAIAASGQAGTSTGRAKAVDGDPATYWSTPGRGAQQPEFITLDLGSTHTLARVTLLSRNAGALFPKDVEIQVSSDNSNFATVATGVDLPATKGMLHTFDFGSTSGRYVRIYVTETRPSAGGSYYAQIAEIEVFEGFPTNVVTVSWTEPGDDGGTGTASSFDLRYSLLPISDFNGATPIDGEPAPQGAGTHTGFHFPAPAEGVTIYFRMKASDEASNLSPVSNQAVAVIPPDITAPASVTDLTGSAAVTVSPIAAPAIAASSQAAASTASGKATDGNASTYWSSVGSSLPTPQWITMDTGASHFIGGVRVRARSPGALFPESLEIQLSNDNLIFTTVHTATGLPKTAGLTHTFEFPAQFGRYVRVNATQLRLSAGGLYYAQIAEIGVDEAAFNVGPVSLSWTAPGDDGPTGAASFYDLRYSTSPIPDLAAFALATPVPGLPAPQSAGAHETAEVPAVQVPDDPGTYYFAVRTRDEANNWSGLSNVAVIVIP
ncbi:MAG TPA: discoidin domain-containing protein, partial [Candidatus Deferrimicrobiaceae bacterium]